MTRDQWARFTAPGEADLLEAALQGVQDAQIAMACIEYRKGDRVQACKWILLATRGPTSQRTRAADKALEDLQAFLQESELEQARRLADAEDPGETPFRQCGETLHDNTGKPHDWSGGTAFLVSREGHYVTCNHCVGKNPALLVITLRPGTATLLGRDERNDIALIKALPDPALEPLKLRTTGPQLGETARSAGYSPMEIQQDNLWCGEGHVTALYPLGQAGTTFALSFALHPGNSGCPILDRSGHLIGMGTSMEKDSRQQAVPKAVRVEAIRRLLQKHNVPFEEARNGPEQSLEDLCKNRGFLDRLRSCSKCDSGAKNG